MLCFLAACRVYYEGEHPKVVCSCLHNSCENGGLCIPGKATMLLALRVFKCYTFFLENLRPPTPRNANSIESYTFGMLLSGKFDIPTALCNT